MINLNRTFENYEFTKIGNCTGCDQVKFRFGHMCINALKLHAILNFSEKIAKIDKFHIL